MVFESIHSHFLSISNHTRCTHFVRYPGAMQIISNIASGTTLSIRVYALYSQAWWVIAVLLPVLIAEIAVESWAVQGGAPAPLPPGVPGCILTGRDDEGIKFATFWAGQLVFPTLIFIMTIIRVLHLRRLAPIRDSILTVLLRDGIMYFLVIFVANTVNVVTYIVAPDDLRFANAPFTNVITTLMICRLMLNLQQRGDASAPSENDVSSFTLDRDISRPTLLGNAGEEIGMGETYTRESDLPSLETSVDDLHSAERPLCQLSMTFSVVFRIRTLASRRLQAFEAKRVISPFSTASTRRRPWNLRKSAYFVLGAGAIYVADERWNASSLTRTFKTFITGAIVAVDYKVNFQPHPPFAKSIVALHARNADRIYDLLRANGGLYLKIGQAVAMQSAVLPPEFQKKFARFFDDAPQNDWKEVKRVIREEFGGRSPDDVFGEIERTARASASVAQVHKARLPDGRLVAVKIQKKEIERQVGWDLWAFGAVMYLYEYFFDLPLYAMVPYISERLKSETDFLNEAKNAELTAARVESDPSLRGRVYIPKVYHELSTRRIMTAEWIDGVRISDKEALTSPNGLNIRLGDIMHATIELFSKQIFQWGDVHSDPHPGNILVRRLPSGAPQVVLLDHGLYVHLDNSFRREYAEFWTALITFDNGTLRRIARKWGIRDSDAIASAVLMRPYQSTKDMFSALPEDADEAERAFIMQERMRGNLREVLGDERIWPRALLFLGRTIRILQADNQMLGSPMNRVKIMAFCASRALANDQDLSLGARLRQWFRHLVFRTVLLSSDVMFYMSRIRQLLGLGEGMESDLEKAEREIAKSFGVELNHELFEG
ncbi:ABC1 domain protein [Sanghuangporus baumii]|uniref:ABC1 domain protein n=1 Tax=Sanghuangporus baumii TaxID=108892 RepID=A0A9Q5HZE5_SANBA|nr:ABC1 domain protein [Sanghuangporus baumii]